MDFRKLLEEAQLSIKTKVKVGRPFEVKELFDGVKWNSLSKGDRISFGKLFANEYREGNIKGIKMLPRGNNSHTRYTKL